MEFRDESLFTRMSPTLLAALRKQDLKEREREASAEERYDPESGDDLESGEPQFYPSVRLHKNFFIGTRAGAGQTEDQLYLVELADKVNELIEFYRWESSDIDVAAADAVHRAAFAAEAAAFAAEAAAAAGSGAAGDAAAADAADAAEASADAAAAKAAAADLRAALLPLLQEALEDEEKTPLTHHDFGKSRSAQLIIAEYRKFIGHPKFDKYHKYLNQIYGMPRADEPAQGFLESRFWRARGGRRTRRQTRRKKKKKYGKRNTRCHKKSKSMKKRRIKKRRTFRR
jgi:hypothetical protein